MTGGKDTRQQGCLYRSVCCVALGCRVPWGRTKLRACAQAVNDVADGQLLWIIRFGSPGTSMPAHKNFTDEQIWQLVAYVRGLAK